MISEKSAYVLDQYRSRRNQPIWNKYGLGQSVKFHDSFVCFLSPLVFLIFFFFLGLMEIVGTYVNDKLVEINLCATLQNALFNEILQI